LAGVRPLRPVTANDTVLVSGRRAGEALSDRGQQADFCNRDLQRRALDILSVVACCKNLDFCTDQNATAFNQLRDGNRE
jgi:hypothetical protein